MTPLSIAIAFLTLSLSSATAQLRGGTIIGWGIEASDHIYDTPSSNDILTVASGWNHAYAIHSDHSLEAWGADSFGQVSQAPTSLSFDDVAASWKSGAGLLTDGSLVAWGYDIYGVVSNVPSGNDFAQIQGGDHGVVALRNDGSLIVWGHDYFGQVSNAPTTNDFVSVAMGNKTVYAIRNDGTIHSWGDDFSGEVSNTPTGYDFIKVAGSYSGGWAMAMHADGSLEAWGTNIAAVVSVPSGTGFKDMAAGGVIGIAIRADGSLVKWGSANEDVDANTPTRGNFNHVYSGSYAFFARGEFDYPRINANGMSRYASATVDATFCTPNSAVTIGFSTFGAGPISTPYGLVELSAPYQLFHLTTDSQGRARQTGYVPIGYAGTLLWFHALDVATGTLTNAVATFVTN